MTASPLPADLEELAVLPETFLIVDENDVLRDEGEAYARKFTEAGVRTTSARYKDTIHDFMMLNPLRETAAVTGAVEQAIHVLRKAWRQVTARRSGRRWCPPDPTAVRVGTTMYRQNEPRPATAEDVRGELRRFHGRPALTRDEDSARMMRRSLDGSCNSAGTLARFVERMSPTEVEALRVALRERLDGWNTEAG